jgi:hypothetical protein
VHVGSRATRKAFKKIRHQLGLQVADEARADFCVDREGCAATEVDSRDGERLIHRHHEVASAQNAALVTEGTIKRFAECDANVFDRVVLIDIEIAFASKVEV